MITSQVTITSQEVIVTSPINEQMVEANVSTVFLIRLLPINISQILMLSHEIFSYFVEWTWHGQDSICLKKSK